MSFSLIPDRVYRQYTEITPQMLSAWGIQLLLCDLDYTLAPRSVATPDSTLHAWLSACKSAGITVEILSNNRSSRRVETFCSELGISYVGHAGKPSVRGYREAMDKNRMTEEHTAMLGDKLLTDILGANRAGILALMVEPLGGPVGLWNHVLHLLQRPFKAAAGRRNIPEKRS